MKSCLKVFLLLASTLVFYAESVGQTYNTHLEKEREILFFSRTGETFRLRFYSDHVVRVQAIREGEDFFADDHYEMVENHNLTGNYNIEENPDAFLILTEAEDGLKIELTKWPMRFRFLYKPDNDLLLADQNGITWEGNKIFTDFQYNDAEHFCGLGHQSFGLVESLDLQGKMVHSNYGDGKKVHSDWGAQAVLTVPFFLSSKGYGVFLNSTHEHSFNFGENQQFQFGIDTKGFEGRMDYFFILGTDFKDILNRYTQLTGRPRLPQQSIFGLQLSDKDFPQHEGVEWWKERIIKHRDAGFPFDHIVNDNRWRSGTGAWSGSWFEWDSKRFPDPQAYHNWCNEHHVTMTLDFNRNIGAASWGWKPEYNLPNSEKYIKEGFCAPDYTNPAVRNWLWELFWRKSFDPALNYPGDALWIDETDELFPLPDSTICSNGRSWAEVENSYHFLVAKAIVKEGWDNANENNPPGIGAAKRPYVWIRGSSAGAQRWATHWTGDLECDYSWMERNVRGMLASGLSGFPYFNHDAGGFRHPGPDDAMYIQWGMALGSFTPIWRPHGPGEYKRWPLERSEQCQAAAKIYSKLRYEMMPYIYTQAHKAYEQGLPMARAMVIDYHEYHNAWKYDTQYMWGDAMLVAPNCSGKDTILDVWLPAGQDWYDFWMGEVYKGDQVIHYKARFGELPIFVKQGAIIPERLYAQSTFTLDPKVLILNIYAGKDGDFTLYEDDNITENYKVNKELRQTPIIYNHQKRQLTIQPAQGTYKGAPQERSYQIYLHGFDFEEMPKIRLEGRRLKRFASKEEAIKNGGVVWLENKKTIGVFTKLHHVEDKIVIKIK